ncbi:uncharacterized protein [Dysidea avara]|uniref:uncharacterized protein n=1 Tax=Dysidea avara TaxID=196820 RepID=UPI00332824AE
MRLLEQPPEGARVLWLHVVISDYLRLLEDHVQKSRAQRLTILNCFFTKKLLETGYSGVQNWYSKPLDNDENRTSQ